MRIKSKLYFTTSEDYVLPDAIHNGAIRSIAAHNIPQMYWPDGQPCWLVNMYLLKGFRSGKSRKNRGGTLLTWANNLSPIIRWCYANRIDFDNLTDSHFRLFVSSLQAERVKHKPELRKRYDDQIGRISSATLNLLAFINETIPNANLLGPAGKIRAEKRIHEVKTARHIIRRSYWWHDCIPRGSKPRHRQPISTAAVEKLYETVNEGNASRFIKRRRYVMLRLFEITGGRRIEVSMIRVQDIQEAQSTGELRLFTAKKQTPDATRTVPVTQADIHELKSFIDHYRAPIIKKAALSNGDSGLLFISEKGLPLKVDTLGSEFAILRKAAGIEDEEACLHAFRHRYLTNIFRTLIRIHRFECEGDLRKAILSTETLKLKVAEWSGHADLSSLDRYIHLAFEAESEFVDTLKAIQIRKIAESMKRAVKNYQDQLHSGVHASHLLGDISKFLDGTINELKALD